LQHPSEAVKPRFEEWSNGSPVLYVLSKNLHLRHLTTSQRSAVAADSVPMLAEEAKLRQGGAGRFGSCSKQQEPDSNGDNREIRGGARDIAAKMMQVSHDTVQGAMDVKKANPKEFERIKRGEITVGAALQRMAGTLGAWGEKLVSVAIR